MKFKLERLGLPNIGNTCYLNASVQSLMTLEPFMANVSSQERVWKNGTGTGLLRYLHAMHESRGFIKKTRRTSLVHSFKAVVASKAPEFRGSQQKDAHEFLTAVFGQIQSLAPTMQSIASSLGTTYRCPVQEQMVFNMDQTRTCQRCGEGSKHTEMFNNLSLNVRQDATTQDLLEDYLKATELEYKCSCGGQMSSQQTSFSTLPNVLMLHLNRFRYTPTYQLEKVNDAVHINRDLVVSSNNDSGCFSLVGVISHLGSTADSGHYVFDGLDLANPLDPTDCWLSYSDLHVQKNTGRDACRNRQKSSYILFYKRVVLLQKRGSHSVCESYYNDFQ